MLGGGGMSIESEELDFVSAIMEGYRLPWFFSGGWAIDLALGRLTRRHDDVDICVFRENVKEFIEFFTEWNIQVENRAEDTNGSLMPFKHCFPIQGMTDYQ